MNEKEVIQIETDNCHEKIIKTYTKLQKSRQNKHFGYTQQLTLINELETYFIRLGILHTWPHTNHNALKQRLPNNNEADYEEINSHINKIEDNVYCENAIKDLKRNIIMQREVENIKHVIKEATQNNWENYNGHYLFDNQGW